MELKKEKWLKKDIKEFEEYLKSLQNKEKQKWTQKIVRSNLKVLAIKNPILKQLANEIYKGNFIVADTSNIKHIDIFDIPIFFSNKSTNFTG